MVVTGFVCDGAFASPPEASSFCVDCVMMAMPGTPIAYTPIVCVFELGVIDEQPSVRAITPPPTAPSNTGFTQQHRLHRVPQRLSKRLPVDLQFHLR